MERRYDAYCGLYCGACYIMVANRQGTVADLARELKMEPEELTCSGCKTQVQPERCAKCEIRACVSGKSIQHCGECAQFPCQRLDEFSKAHPHLHELQSNCRAMKEDGIEMWLEQQKDRWTCPNCGTPFSWYKRKCPACGASLSASKRARTGTV